MTVIFLVLVALLFTGRICQDFEPLSAKEGGTYFGNKACTSDTPSPIDVWTPNTTPKNCTPLQIDNLLFPSGKATLCNHGDIVILAPADVDNSSIARMRGGPFLDQVYKFVQINFLWDAYAGRPSGNQINTRSYELTAVFVFIKEVYENLETAKKERDGIVLIDVQNAITCHRPVQEYNIFYDGMRQVKQANTCVSIPAEGSIAWIPDFNLYRGYYAYLGNYYDRFERKRYNSAIVLVFPHSATGSVGLDQFLNTFGYVENPAGDKYVNIYGTWDSYDREIIECQDVYYNKTVV